MLLAVALVLPLLLPAPQHWLTIDIGAEQGLNQFGESASGFYLFDFHPAEREGTGATYRWTQGFSSLRLLNIFTLGAPLALELRACGCRPAAAPASEASLQINDSQLLLPLDSQPRTYHLLVAPKAGAASRPTGNDLYLALISTTFTLPGDDRALGLRLDRVGIAPLNPWALLGLPPLVAWGLYAMIVLAGLFWRVGRQRQAGMFFSLLMVAVLLSLPYLYRPHIFPPLALAVLSLLALGGVLLVTRGIEGYGVRIILAGAALWLVWSTELLGHWMLDDAYISFRYAANMLSGNGLVFNPGERVEGYTNFLWTMLMALPLAWGLDPALPSAILTLALGIGTLLLTYAWGARNEELRKKNAELYTERESTPALLSILHSQFSALFLALSAPFLLYTARGSGMETALFTLLLLAGSFAAQQAGSFKAGLAAGVLLALAALTRPDGVLGLIAAAGSMLLGTHKGLVDKTRTTGRGFSTLIAMLLGFAALFVPYYIWRYAYYGYPLPNTFYAKVGTGWAQVQRGLDYGGEFALAVGWPFVVLLLLGVAIVRGVALLRPYVLLVGLYCAYTVAVGGDHFPGLRFFVPILPFLALLMQAALIELANRLLAPAYSPFTRFNLLVQAGLMALILCYLAYLATLIPASDARLAGVRGEYNVVEKNRELGLWLRDNTPPDTIVATGIAGALPFYSGLRVIDTLGLNDLHIAHLEVQGMGSGVAGAEKTDILYVLEQRPDYIPFSTSGPFQENARFQRDYQLIEVRGPEGRAIKLYQRR